MNKLKKNLPLNIKRYLNLPQGFAASGGRSAGPPRGPQEDVLPPLVLVHGEELLLLGVEQSHHVPTLQHLLLIFLVF